MSETDNRQWILASSSAYRAGLLARFGRAVQSIPPQVDESQLAGESPDQLAERLARKKTAAVAARVGEAIVIGSDQVAVCDDMIMGKPGSHEAAVQQLMSSSGRWVRFLTGLSVIDTTTSNERHGVEEFNVRFRELDAKTIESYLTREQPYDCAGSFKSEGLGIALFSEFRGRDPNSLIGLPLMLLTDYLLELGVNVMLP